MSWSDVFPILTDELVEAFELWASTEQKSVLEEYFSVAAVINARPEAKHLLSTSLFWKNIRTDMPEIKIASRREFMKPGKKLLRFDPWSYYTVPLLQGAYWLSKKRPEAVLRVYLAADLEFLIPDLEAAGIEIYLMKSNSIAHNPGALWRFLAFEERDKLVTLLDAERVAKPGPQMDQTVEMDRMGLGWWRVPVWGELNEIGNVSYRPFVGCHLGGNTALPVGLLMKALIWCTQQGLIDPTAKLPGCQPAKIHGYLWPDYGFDEYFLLTAVYPRAAFDGVLSFIPAEAKSRLMPLDIEYVQWANNKSQIVYFGSAGSGCGPDKRAATANPTVAQRVVVRENTGFVLRESEHTAMLVKALAPGMVNVLPRKSNAGPETALAQAAKKVKQEWWVDLGQDFVPAESVAELFLDRRYENADVAVTGWEFVELTAELAAWGKRRGADKAIWQAGGMLKIPKLTGSITLWRAAFSQALHHEFIKQAGSNVTVGLLLRLWQDLGKARVLSASAKSQGWQLKTTQVAI